MAAEPTADANKPSAGKSNMAPPDLREHLSDLALLATNGANAPGLMGVSARDIGVSIENVCKNALDDEIAGAASMLFDRESGLPTVLVRSIDSAHRNDKELRELRVELLKLIDWLIVDLGAHRDPLSTWSMHNVTEGAPA